MNRTGVLLTTRRSWPLPGGWEHWWSRLLAELVRRGRRATVLTPRLRSDWPTETVSAGVRIVRLAPPGAGPWGEARYLARLRQAVTRHHTTGDVVLTAGLRGDAYAVLAAARQAKFRTILFPEQPGIAGDCHWQIEARCGARVKRQCMRADALAALTPLLERELIAAGYPRRRIRLLAPGVSLPRVVDDRGRRDARRALAHADPALALPPDAPLFVWLGNARAGHGLSVLLDAWRRAAAAWPTSYLWLVGEIADATPLHRQIAESNLESRVRIAGAFDDPEDVFRAADAAVFPALQDGPAFGLLEAAAYGLPIIASNLVTHVDRLTDGTHALIYPRGDAGALADAVERVVRHRPQADAMGEAARRHITGRYSLERSADEVERLLDELVMNKSP